MIARVFISIFLAIVVTFSLFWGMQALIFMDKMEKPTKEKRARINLGEVRDATEMEQKVRKPDKPDEQEAPPEAAPPEMDNSADTNAISLAAPTAQANTGIEMGGGGGFAMSDGDMLPIARIPAAYPRRAQERGLEGYVVLDFTVTKLGKTANVVVLESTSKVFEKPAIKATLRYRYKPKVVDGEAMDVHHVQTKVTFEMSKKR
jgi:protein TonB